MILLFLLLAPAEAFKMTDLSRTSGITPIKIQDSFVINQTYTYMHNINLRELQVELDKINTSLQLIDSKMRDKTQGNILKLHLDITQNKLNHIFYNKQRAKRGLINGLGSAVSWLTGNMDADDKAKYDAILEKVQSNEYNLEHNVENN